jgi:hypothetical protein
MVDSCNLGAGIEPDSVGAGGAAGVEPAGGGSPASVGPPASGGTKLPEPVNKELIDPQMPGRARLLAPTLSKANTACCGQYL